MKKNKTLAAILILGLSFLVLVAIGRAGLSWISDRFHDRFITAELPVDHYTYYDIPDLTMDEIRSSCSMFTSEREQYDENARQYAGELSYNLEEYIRAWYYGDADPVIPDGLLPDSIDNEKTHDWKLLKPEEVLPEEQWYVFPAHEVDPDFEELYQHAIDTHVTYLRLIILAPLDSQLLVDGDFPHAREMSFHIIRPFDPRFPGTGNIGVMEVPLIDVDIIPDEGHTNPFLTNADRNAVQRHYHVTFELKPGDPTDLNPVLDDVHYRAPGNVRVGGPFIATGLYGDGAIIPSTLWLRYYAPDHGTGPFAGVTLPRALYRLETGETFWLMPDDSLARERQMMLAEGVETQPVEPVGFFGSDYGWLKMFGIWEIFAESTGRFFVDRFSVIPPALIKREIRSDLDCFFNQAPDNPSPGNIPHSATDCPYNNYLIRHFWLGDDKVYAITGRMPTTPETRNGEMVMQAAEARYWSICHAGSGKNGQYQNAVYGCLMDDEVTVDSNHDYIIVWSRGNERPANARPECGVTWQDFGPESVQSANLRWMSVYPDHFMDAYNPHDSNVPWNTGAWMQTDYDHTLVGQNQAGAMGPYHPVIHYLTREEFEALGCPVAAEAIPEWKE